MYALSNVTKNYQKGRLSIRQGTRPAANQL